MNYELAKELKEAGFPQPDPLQEDGNLLFPGTWLTNRETGDILFSPTLSGLIEACGENFKSLIYQKPQGLAFGDWQANAYTNPNGDNFVYGMSPEEAVARLWLAFNKK